MNKVKMLCKQSHKFADGINIYRSHLFNDDDEEENSSRKIKEESPKFKKEDYLDSDDSSRKMDIEDEFPD